MDNCVLARVQGTPIRLGAAGSLLSGKDVQLLQQRMKDSSFQSRNVYFNLETSSLHWKSKLKNVWGQ